MFAPNFNTPTHAATRLAISSFVFRVVSAISAWNDARVTRNALSRLTEAELDDIGLTRTDIDHLTWR